jgi:NADH:quinone reductase (non-electrogenic)
MGRYVGRLIAAHAAQRPLPPPFRYRHMGDLATIGRQAPVVKLGRVELTGFLGWLFWGVVHIYFLVEARDSLHRLSPGCGSTSPSSAVHD